LLIAANILLLFCFVVLLHHTSTIMSSRVAFVTGASSGIGEALVRKLIGDGFRVAGVARRQERLLAIQQSLADAAASFLPVVADVSSSTDVDVCTIAPAVHASNSIADWSWVGLGWIGLDWIGLD
jgi:NAD(P)-dependent dehydrogenase (short-subunit alcohol dehydrogenase family)